MKGYCKLEDPVGSYGADWRMGRSAVLRRETPKCKGKQDLKSLGLQVLVLLRKLTPSPIIGRTYAR